MKIIVTGSTGNVGGAVLDRCLAHPQVTSVVALTRRPLDIEHPKLTTIIHKNFLEYDQSTLSQLAGAQACIWALGAPTSSAEVHGGYAFAAVRAIQESIVPNLDPASRFRFVSTSGGLVPFLDSPALFFLGSGRTHRGDMDRDLCKLNSDRWESVVVRPLFVIYGDTPNIALRMSGWYIPREELAAAMVDAALNGSEIQILTNAECREKGQAALLKDGK